MAMACQRYRRNHPTQHDFPAESLRRLTSAVHARGMERAEKVWKRAVNGLPDDAREGDRALAAAVHFHHTTMDGGVVYAFAELDGETLEKAVDGFRWLGLGQASDFLERVAVQLVELGDGTYSAEPVANRSQLGADDLDPREDDDYWEMERIEERSDRDYNSIIEGENTIFAALHGKVETEPEAFLPLQRQ